MRKKRCTRCGLQLCLTAFYREKRAPDGRASGCKPCTKAAAQFYRLTNISRIRAYDRLRYQKPERKQYFKDLAQTEKRKKAQAEARKAYRERNPKKTMAHRLVSAAKMVGLIEVEQCEACGTDRNLHAHHDDYDKPLEIRWLCTFCHRQWHADNGPGLNG